MMLITYFLLSLLFLIMHHFHQFCFIMIFIFIMKYNYNKMFMMLWIMMMWYSLPIIGCMIVSVVCLIQGGMKYLIAYSYISHKFISNSFIMIM